MYDFNVTPKALIDLLPNPYRGDFSEHLLVTDIQTDSRKVAPGALFIALPGLTVDGEKYIGHAVANGAVAVLVDSQNFERVMKVEAPVIGVENLTNCVVEIAKRFYSDPAGRLKLVGVTGTNGKSTIVSLVAQLASLLGEPAATLGTLGYGLVDQPLSETGMTTPDVVHCQRILAELVEIKTKIVAMEVSSHGVDQGRIDGLDFSVAVLSNISHDHLDYHGSFENYRRVKHSFLLSQAAAAAVINADDENCAVLLPQLQEQKKKTITYSVEGARADLSATVRGFSENGIDATLVSYGEKSEIFVPLIGKFNLGNILAAVAALLHLGYELEPILNCLDQLHPVEGRLQRVTVTEGNQAPNVFVDFAHTPDALEQVLRALRHHVKGKLWVVFGCGGDRDRAKRPLMGGIASRFADRVVVTSDNPRSENPAAIIDDILQGVGSDATVEKIAERDLAISMAIGSCDLDDCVLLAGKGHEDYQVKDGVKIPFSDYLVAQEALNNRINARSFAQ